MGSQNVWQKVEPVEAMNFAEIMSEEYAHRVHNKEWEHHAKPKLDEKAPATSKANSDDIGPSYSQVAAAAKVVDDGWEDYSALLTPEEQPKDELPTTSSKSVQDCDSDELLAKLLQSQFDNQYNEELRRTEEHRNKNRKVTVSLDKFRRNGDTEFLNEPSDAEQRDSDDDDDDSSKRDWDRFETNENLLDAIPKCGFKLNKEDGEFITKHDDKLCSVRNACRVMSFPPEFATGDGAGFDMRLSNKVFNELRTYSRHGGTNRFSAKRNRKDDRRFHQATADMGLDGPTCLILYKLINNQLLEQINGIVSTGKEALILHAKSDPAYAEMTGPAPGKEGGPAAVPKPKLLPKECAIKVFKTTLNEFKQRDRYIKDDYRFRDRFSKQNKNVVIHMWAEKEMHNLLRMQRVGINCPDVIVLKKHVLIMSFIGDGAKAAPKLRDARLNEAELSCAYEEIVAAMHKLYNEAKLVHADLSEYNILWYEDKCWFIDVAQSVEPDHPSALEFLMRDCGNIISFFTKCGLSKLYSKEELFEHITALNAEAYNAAMLERIHTRGESVLQATAPNREQRPDLLRPTEFPFELAWEKSQLDRKIQQQSRCSDATARSDVAPSSSVVAVGAAANTAEH